MSPLARPALPPFVTVGDYVGHPSPAEHPRFSVRFRLQDGRSGIVAWSVHAGDAEGFAEVFADQQGEAGRVYAVVDERTGVVTHLVRSRR